MLNIQIINTDEMTLFSLGHKYSFMEHIYTS